ncbi:integrative conjugal element protein [Mycoplasma mycoides]|uniref:integrative conjugal element protein n=1 Tax=Mycoplasma mycoides TaxID=2102 RepID=UPI002240DF71|nr:integrative conjugal element protein [Mycoplasma mycoides]QVK09460.1 integrative conjugal element protein [Mycoplasma mycoides subsp. capri]
MKDNKTEFDLTISNAFEDDFGMELEEKVAKQKAKENEDLAKSFINKNSISQNVQIERDLFLKKDKKQSNKPLKVGLYITPEVNAKYEELVQLYKDKYGKAPTRTDVFVQGIGIMIDRLKDK